MGTRGLTAVMVDGVYRIAQYGQWDHYPSGQGVTALAFLRTMDEPKFREALGLCRFLTDAEHKAMWDRLNIKGEWITMGESARFYAQPEARLLHRDHGAKVLALVMEGEGERLLSNSITFAGDSLMCEYAYVVDLDKRTFEVFKGFNKGPMDATTDRFAESPTDGNGYSPVRLIGSFSLDNLPTDDEFTAALKPKGEEDDE